MVLLGRPLAAEDHCGWPGSGQFRDVHGHKAWSPAATAKDITGKPASNPDQHSTDADTAAPAPPTRRQPRLVMPTQLLS